MFAYTPSRREKMLVGVAAGLLALYLFLTLVHQPLIRGRDEARDQRDRIQGLLEKDRERLAREGDLAARELHLTAREQAIAALVPGRHAAGIFIYYLGRVVDQSGVHIRSVQAGERKGAGDLTEVSLDLDVDGIFASHVLFQQHLQNVPLFFNLKSWKLDRNREAAVARAGELFRAGKPWEAEAILREHPRLTGAYQLTLYFRTQGSGPDPGALGAAAAAGRPDPFLDQLIDEFVHELQAAYGDQGSEAAGNPAPRGPDRPDPPGGGPTKPAGQMG